MLRIAVLTTSLATLSHASNIPREIDNNNLPLLKFSASGTFQLAVFSDFHFGQDASSTGPEQDGNSVKVIEQVLDYDPPDLVILNGDLINGESTYAENSTHYIDQIVAPIVERNLTWASTYGNHDHNYNISGDGILKREHLWPGARTQKMVNSTYAGITNYYLQVYADDCTDSKECSPELLLWFFDSRGGFYYQGGAQGAWVDTSVVAWFNDTNRELVAKHNKVIPSLAFVHIPIRTTEALKKQLGVDANYQPGIDNEPVVPQQGGGSCSDTKDENCDYGPPDSPFIEALATIPGVIGLFYGHDHGNSWCYRWDSEVDGISVNGSGIYLCYGQHSGYGGYGDWIRGAREIIVTQSKLDESVVDTHIRLESGDVVGNVSLNSTFNTDHYPATPNDKTYMSDSRRNGNSISGLSMGSSVRSEQFQLVYMAASGLFVSHVWSALWG